MKFEDYSFFSKDFCGSDEEGIQTFRFNHETKKYCHVDYYMDCDGIGGRVLEGTFEVDTDKLLLTLTNIRNEIYEVRYTFIEDLKTIEFTFLTPGFFTKGVLPKPFCLYYEFRDYDEWLNSDD